MPNTITITTTKVWGHAESYDLCIDASILGLEKTKDLIADFNQKEKSLMKRIGIISDTHGYWMINTNTILGNVMRYGTLVI